MVKGALLRSTIVAAFGGLLFGFDTAVISGTTNALQTVFKLSSQGLGFTVASALIGTIIGAMTVGKPADLLGRKKLLMISAVLFLISAAGSGLAWNWFSLLLFRFIGGLAIGACSVVGPMYIAEISPAPMRGRLVAVMQFNIVLGILIAFFSNYVIKNMGLGDVEWRWMFGVLAFPSAVFMFLLSANPDSPRWLVYKNRKDQAKNALASLGADKNIDEEIADIELSLRSESQNMQERLFTKKYSRPIMLAVMIAIFNQLSGINAIMYYTPYIFKLAGAAESSAMLQTVAIGGILLVFTLFGMAAVDHFGRKKLMLAGSIGYIIGLTTVAAMFYKYGKAENFTQFGSMAILIGAMVFIASHAFGQGAVIWTFTSEIFPNAVRARGLSLGCFAHWVMCAAVSWTFPVIANISGGHAFAFFACMMVLQLLWVIFVMPETKGIPLEEIQKKLNIG